MLFLNVEIVTTFYSCYAKPGLFTSFEFCALTSIIRLSVLWETERGKKTSSLQVSAGYSRIQLKTSHLFPSFTVKKRHLWNQLQTKGQRNTHTHTQRQRKRQQKSVFNLMYVTHFPTSQQTASIPLRFPSHLTSEEIASFLATPMQLFSSPF